jgi:putative SOS response-associated peptidase YedK
LSKLRSPPLRRRSIRSFAVQARQKRLFFGPALFVIGPASTDDPIDLMLAASNWFATTSPNEVVAPIHDKAMQ